ncbi:hypothetical protein PtA15_12A462 [Puccinia triticina]|uniref:DNA helicase n=1 Tax=Puccinia triticina TaxID=208348 RepID=A0ABY7CYT8_9BASI|nr:uncharacterized protein PtA15_12A462 [Puccinia triticina]WAQ90473.1 hypothetical protein PtA15_12A462 [Puccinia triticina]
MDSLPGEGFESNATDNPAPISARDSRLREHAMAYEEDFPPLKITIKAGMVAMLTEPVFSNISVPLGAKIVVKEMNPLFVTGTVIGNGQDGQKILVPKVVRYYSNPEYMQVPFSWSQFPLRAAFAVSVGSEVSNMLSRAGLLVPAANTEGRSDGDWGLEAALARGCMIKESELLIAEYKE